MVHPIDAHALWLRDEDDRRVAEAIEEAFGKNPAKFVKQSKQGLIFSGTNVLVRRAQHLLAGGMSKPHVAEALGLNTDQVRAAEKLMG